MTSSSNPMLKLILDSKALSIWNHKTGPVFWYAAGVPGPFYLNTELMIGRELADRLLEAITTIVAKEPEPKTRAEALRSVIMAAYEQHADFRAVIRALVEQAKKDFPAGTYTAVSGGERRDWLFSIPLAEEMGIKHIYFFKNQSVFCAEPLTGGEKTLHVSDLINNAASYFDMWLPMMQKASLSCVGTLTVNTRGTAGVKRMEEAGYKVVALNRIELPFFQELAASGLIDRATLDEVALYLTSAKDWAARYVMQDAALFDIAHLDKKSLERMTSFFAKDPWGLEPQHQAFFATMRTAIAARQAA